MIPSSPSLAGALACHSCGTPVASTPFRRVMEEQPMLDHEQSIVGSEPESVSLKSAVITFDPDQILRAICFHLLDDQHANGISAISVYQTRDRLRRQRVKLQIARRQWEEMRN